MTHRQILLALIVPTTWGLGFALAKVGMDTFPPFFLMSIRFGLAALVLVWFTKAPFGFMRKIFLIALVSATIQYGFTFYGLKGIDASTAIIIVQLESPFLALLAALFLKDKLGWKRATGMILAFSGVSLIAGEPRLEGNLIYVSLVATGAMIWAIGQVMVRQLSEVTGFTLVAWVAVFASPQMLIASLLIETNHWNIIINSSWTDWIILLYLGIIMTALAYSIWYQLLASCSLMMLAPFLLLTPVTTILFGTILLDEIFTKTMAIGSIMVIGGVAATTMEKNKKDEPVDKVSLRN